MKLSSFKRAVVATATAAAGAAMLFSATPASAANPPYDGCPGWAICLYENVNGGGSKVIVTPDASGVTRNVSLTSAHFLNGKGANDQVTSWLNNTNCQVIFYDAPPGNGNVLQIGFASSNNYGARGDWTNTMYNDRLSGLQYFCP
jgi:hypothetical protein